MSGITCEKELAKIKAKAEKRHQQYLKYKLSSPPKKIPLKRDIIATLQKEIDELKLKISNDKEPEPNEEPKADADAEAEPEADAEAEPEADAEAELEAELEAEPDEEPEVEKEPLGIEDIYPYDDIVNEEINPLNENKGCGCVLNPEFTLTAILDAIEDYKWRNETIKAFVIHSINTLLIEKGYLPTCVKCLEEVVKRLDYVEDDKHKKKMYIQAVIMIIKMIEIPLRNDVIDKYMSIYTHYRAL